jgi:hypothetical protein
MKKNNGFTEMTTAELVAKAKEEVANSIRAENPVNGKVVKYCINPCLVLALANRLKDCGDKSCPF